MLNSSVSLTEFLLNFSQHMGYFSASLSNHQLRVALISMDLSRLYGLDKESRNDLLIASLVHDLGAFTDETKKKLLNDFDCNNSDHSIAGSYILKQAGFHKIADIVAHHHDTFDQLKYLDANTRTLTELLKLADTLDRYNMQSSRLLSNKSDVTNAFSKGEQADLNSTYYDLILELVQSNGYIQNWGKINIHEELEQFVTPELDINYSTSVVMLSKIIMTLVDLKSEHTCNHSWRVARAAYAIGYKFGLEDKSCKELLIAGNFHDLGKLSIPSSVLDKSGALDKSEFEIMKNHVKVTYDFLSSMNFIQLAKIAGYHHERLDGTGYPFNLMSEEMCCQSKIMAVADVFGALVEDRPYRKALDDNVIKGEFKRLSDTGKLDRSIINLVNDQYDSLKEYVNYISDDFNKPLVHISPAFK